MGPRKRRIAQGETVELNDMVSNRADRIEGLHADNCELVGPIGLLMTADELVTNRISGELGSVQPNSEATSRGVMILVDCEFRYCALVDVSVYVPEADYERALAHISD